MNLGIASYSAITIQGIHKDGALIHENRHPEDFHTFARKAYRELDIQYPRFFKMDELCKLAFLAAEVLSGQERRWEGPDTALVLGNRNSSLASDLKHQQAIRDRNNYFPSPAVFVYTLSNIMLGELCIRHKITGENSCFMMDRMDDVFLYRYVRELFTTAPYQSCVTGWVDYTASGFAAYLYWVRRQTGQKIKNMPTFNENFSELIPAYHG